MVFKRHWPLVTGLLLAGLMVSLPLAAQRYNSSGNRGYEQGVDLDSTVKRIRRETGGRVLHAETKNYQGHREHRVRIITDRGEVKRYRVDAASGKVMSRDKKRR